MALLLWFPFAIRECKIGLWRTDRTTRPALFARPAAFSISHILSLALTTGDHPHQPGLRTLVEPIQAFPTVDSMQFS
jgi:hypothetical protein